MDKLRIRQAIIDQLTEELAVQTRAALSSRDEATSEESKAENKYDTRGQEAAYLAEGQARLAAELQESLNVYLSLELPSFPGNRPIGVGAYVVLESAARRAHYFLGPRHGGMEVEVEDTTVLVITPSSPLGRELLGRKIGDAVRLIARGATTTYRIVAVE